MKLNNKTGNDAAAYTTAANFLKDYITRTLEQAIALVRERSWQDNVAAFEEARENLKLAFRLRTSLARVISHPGFGETPLYLASAAFLRRAYETVTETADENLIYITGPEARDVVFALSRIVQFALAQRSPINAVPEPTSQLDALIKLDDAGQRLLATVHSHPGRGAAATHPSGVDLSTQRHLEQAGYPTIGAIFSRDGYVRFYTVARQFAVSISGNGVEQLEDCVFHLKGAHESVSHPRRMLWIRR